MNSEIEDIEKLTYLFMEGNPNLSEKQIRQKFIDVDEHFDNNHSFNTLLSVIYGIVRCNIESGQVEKYDALPNENNININLSDEFQNCWINPICVDENNKFESIHIREVDGEFTIRRSTVNIRIEEVD